MDNASEDPGNTVVTIGTSDGIHLGHRRLIAAAVSDARARGVKSLLMTLDPNPVALFTLDKAPLALFTVSRHAELAEAERIDVMLIVSFDKAFSSIPAEDLVHTVVRDRLNMQAAFVGQNLTYDQKASGTAETLPEHDRKYGVDVTIADLPDVTAADSTEHVSSIRIRGLLADGAVSAAASRLGYFHRVGGDVIPGQGRGGVQLGFPIVNIDFAESLAVPADGVYAVWFTVQPTAARPGPDPKDDIESGMRYSAAVLMGTNVTFGDTDRTVETCMIDHHADLYGTAGQVEFVDRIRGMEKFNSIEGLIDRMNQDVADIEAILAKAN